jgi:hypothetical protein
MGMVDKPFCRGVLMRVAGLIAVTVVLLAALPRMATAICCVCEGSTFSNCASGPPSCAECESVCATLGATMRACCNAENCSGGVADACPTAGTLCQQTEVGPGFCDGTCTNPAPASAPVLTTRLLLLALVLLGGFGMFDLRRRMRNSQRSS